MSSKKLQTELICGFTTEAAACTASNNEVCTVHAAASFYQSDCWRLAIMSESERESIRVPSPPLKKNNKRGSVIITISGYRTSKE